MTGFYRRHPRASNVSFSGQKNPAQKQFGLRHEISFNGGIQWSKRETNQTGHEPTTVADFAGRRQSKDTGTSGRRLCDDHIVLRFARTASRAVQFIQDLPADLLLVDLEPAADEGLELLRQFREQPPQPPAFVIALAADGDTAGKLRAFELGVFDLPDIAAGTGNLPRPAAGRTAGQGCSRPVAAAQWRTDEGAHRRRGRRAREVGFSRGDEP